MSTAIALQDMRTSPNKEMGTIRHRNISKSNTTSSMASEDDPWLSTPHDIEGSKLPLETRSFHPTAVYWISPHGMLTKNITVLDLSKDMDVPYTGMTNEYKEEVKKTLKDHSFTPAVTCQRTNWLGLKYDIADDQNRTIAQWSHPWSSVGEAILSFPEDSTHSPHPISLRNKRWGLRTESFVHNSVPYFWEMDSLWHSTNMTLYRVVGSGDAQNKIEVGKYAQKWWGAFVTGGTFVVDEKELNGVVAFNRDLKQHSRKVYSRQMIEHVVEQIDTLYWENGAQQTDDEEGDTAADDVEDANTLYQTDDLTLDENIAKLPTVFPSSTFASSTYSAEAQDEYLSAVSRLQSLSAHRQTLQNRLTTYNTLLSLLEPYRNPKENIQPNLVWKDAPLAPELAKVRTLAIRVAGRIGERWGDVQVPATAEEDDEEMDVHIDELGSERKKKVDDVLASW
ncbi:kinetochore complex Fta4 of Sim4 subunit, or CENP-50-domain-containing protein [Pyrenochaeta sp. MPI-SDFR-AT-0127]|nr:kinetochore complex Fta4 of Sim4 subunit, or CENP-50-domain-containing protein [Pyrenochaeta sp. MPI-SDFR-AT-0127]